MSAKDLSETADEDRQLIIKHNYNEALVQTISEEDFHAKAIETMSEEWGNDNTADTQGVIVNLLETIDEAPVHNEVDFRIETDDVNLAGEGLGKDPFEEDRPNRYSIKGLLGKGGMGQVFAVSDNNFDREVAVKFLHPSAASNPKKMADFFREAKLTSKLEHPNILPIHDVNVSDGGLPYFSMRKAEGRSLREVIDGSTLAKPQDEITTFIERAAIIIKVCDAISYAHSQDIIHQDIKPANIMLGSYGEVVLVDWGTAKHGDESLDGESRLLGTPVYMAPEQARREDSTELSDVYCLGTTFFHLLTMRYPTWSDDADAFWQMKKGGFISALTDEEMRIVPAPLLSIANKAMAADPNDRYQTVLDMRNDVISYQRGLKVLAHNDTMWEVLKRTYTLNARAVWAAALSFAIVGFLVYLVYVEVMKSQSDWQVVYENDFNTATLEDVSKHWQGFRFHRFDKKETIEVAVDSSGPWFVKDGAIHSNTQSFGESYYNLSFKQTVPGDMRVEWDYTVVDNNHSVNCFIGAHDRFAGYQFHISDSRSEYFKYCTKQDRFVDQQKSGTKIEMGQTYRYRMEKEGQYVRLFINNVLEIEIEDVDILNGPGHQTFGFEGLRNHLVIDNVKISSRPLPLKISPILVANSLFNDQKYDTAIEHYRSIAHAYPETELDAVATYRLARSLFATELYDDALISYNRFLYKFKDHELYYHVQAGIAQVYLAKQKWDQAEQCLQKIADADVGRSLRRTCLSFIENALGERVDYTNPRSAYRDDILEEVAFVETKIAQWTQALDVEMPDFNTILTLVPNFILYKGDFDKGIEKHYSHRYPWHAISAYRIKGEYENITSMEGRNSGTERTWERMQDWDSYKAYAADKEPILARISLAQNDLKGIQEHSPKNLKILGNYYLHNQMYAEALMECSSLDRVHGLALLGLGRFSEVNEQKFPNLKNSKYLDVLRRAQLMDGKIDQILAEKDKDYRPEYVNALAYNLLSHYNGDNETYQSHLQNMNKQMYIFDPFYIDESAFARYILPPFLLMIRERNAGKHIERPDYAQLIDQKPYNEVAFIRQSIALISGEKPNEQSFAVFYFSEVDSVLLQAMHQDMKGHSAQAAKLYQKFYDSVQKHKRTLPSAFALQRAKELL
ncbi:MAG: protein kinase [Planctomycetes bacterium]|nr:protein kinase [Planctomycetota bacterium]